jgi:hypothetical protein
MPAVASLAIAGPRRSVEMHQMTGSVDSTLRLFDLADEGRFLLMSHVCGDWTTSGQDRLPWASLYSYTTSPPTVRPAAAGRRPEQLPYAFAF